MVSKAVYNSTKQRDDIFCKHKVIVNESEN